MQVSLLQVRVTFIFQIELYLVLEKMVARKVILLRSICLIDLLLIYNCDNCCAAQRSNLFLFIRVS